MKKKVVFISLGIVLLVAGIVGLIFWLRSSESSGETEKPVSAGLIQPSDLIYKGAFALPEGSSDAESWMYAGSAMTYYPAGDPNGPDDGYPGSIFGTGHEQYQYISEISIPEPIVSEDKDPAELNTAETLQEFTDIKGNMFGEMEIPRVGLEYFDDRLYFCWVPHLYDVDNAPSHGSCSIDLSNPDIEGPYKLKDQIDYVTTDYIFTIPKSFADKYTNGMRLVTGRYRDGGQGSQGPTVIAYNPISSGAELESQVLLKYSSVVEDPNAEQALDNYQHSDAWNGAVWAETSTKQSVIFVGVKGNGETWYGYGDGTVWPEDPPYPEPGEGERGWWSEEFAGEFLFYDPADLARVAKGEIEAYEPQPYAVLDITDYLYNVPENEIWMMIGAMSFDSENGNLYLFEYNGDSANERTIVHVWKVS